jgi:hypothetical protein
LSTFSPRSVDWDVSATAEQVASGPEWGESLVVVAQSRLRCVDAPRLRLSEALHVFNSGCDALQGRESTDTWFDRVLAAVGDGPHAVVTVAADIAAETTELSRADAAQVSRMRVFVAEPIIVRAVSWPHTPESESERRSAQALLDAVGATLAPEYETDPRASFVGVERRVHVLLSQLRSRAPEHVIEQAV